jgi:hypothetical protein
VELHRAINFVIEDRYIMFFINTSKYTITPHSSATAAQELWTPYRMLVSQAMIKLQDPSTKYVKELCVLADIVRIGSVDDVGVRFAVCNTVFHFISSFSSSFFFFFFWYFHCHTIVLDFQHSRKIQQLKGKKKLILLAVSWRILY